MEEKLNQLTMGKAFLIGVVLTVVYYFMWYNNGAVEEGQIATAQQEVQKSRAELEKIKQALVDAERYQKAMAELGAEMERVVKAIPAELNSLDLMKAISTEAKSVGAEINNLNAPTSSAGRSRQSPAEGATDFYEVVPIDVDITGTYNQLMLFLSNLTKLDKIITAQKLTMSISQRGSGASVGSVPIINMKASLQAYRYSPPSLDESGRPSSSGRRGR